MKRDYFTGKHDDVIFFTGVEVEKTPAYDLDTLFVVGAQPISDILEQIEKGYTTHIYLGANQSFHIDISQNHQGEIKLWSDIIFKLLDKGYWVTLDYDIKYHNWVLDCNFNEHQKFISQISVKLPSIEKLNYNACIKIDDRDYNYSNPGVWVHTVHDLKKRKVFTPWSEYEDDEPLGNENNE